MESPPFDAGASDDPSPSADELDVEGVEAEDDPEELPPVDESFDCDGPDASDVADDDSDPLLFVEPLDGALLSDGGCSPLDPDGGGGGGGGGVLLLESDEPQLVSPVRVQ